MSSYLKSSLHTPALCSGSPLARAQLLIERELRGGEDELRVLVHPEREAGLVREDAEGVPDAQVIFDQNS